MQYCKGRSRGQKHLGGWAIAERLRSRPGFDISTAFDCHRHLGVLSSIHAPLCLSVRPQRRISNMSFTEAALFNFSLGNRFLILQIYRLNSLNHIYIWQVDDVLFTLSSPHLWYGGRNSEMWVLSKWWHNSLQVDSDKLYTDPVGKSKKILFYL